MWRDPFSNQNCPNPDPNLKSDDTYVFLNLNPNMKPEQTLFWQHLVAHVLGLGFLDLGVTLKSSYSWHCKRCLVPEHISCEITLFCAYPTLYVLNKINAKNYIQ